MITAFKRWKQWRRRRQLADRIGYLIRHQRYGARMVHKIMQEKRIHEMAERRMKRGWA